MSFPISDGSILLLEFCDELVKFIYNLVSDSCTDKLLIEFILLKYVSISANDYTVNLIIHMLIC